MFVLQPMFGKLLLPLLGGTPAVWNTCMVFYQTLLFLGYLYAHKISQSLTPPRQIQIHTVLLIISLFTLPISLPANPTPPSETDPTFWLIGTLLVSIGLPFFVLSTTAPLLQRWFSQSGHTNSHDPYFLYTASNLGSLIALLSYPFAIEPNIGLSTQEFSWSIAFGALTLFILLTGTIYWRNQTESDNSSTIVQELNNSADELPTQKQEVHWLLLALIPSSLLLGLTQFISTDIASVPLLWIVPLLLYLLSFILVFSKWAPLIHPLMLKTQPGWLVIFIAYSFINPAVIPYWLDLIIHLTAFFLAVMVCHGELARRRPAATHLTRFYLIMSFGGMLGGLFNTFLAPFLFNAVYEYPIMIVASLMMRPGFMASDWKKSLIFPGVVLIAGLVLVGKPDQLIEYIDVIGGALILLTGLLFSVRGTPLPLAVLTGIILFFSIGLHSMASSTLFQKRTFFGVLSVRDTVIPDENGRPETVRELYHGTTKHGAERLTPGNITTPLTYYSRPGPIGQIFAEFEKETDQWSIGSVGLGAGALACYTKPAQQWRFYEIDPLVVEVAKDPNWFHYLEKCNPNATMIVGDARLSLAKEPDNHFDLLIMDAFSSDAVPTHLITQEALDMYLKKVKDTGIIAFHITNRHLTLKNVLANHVTELKVYGLLQEFKPETEQPLVVSTDWVVISKNQGKILQLQQSRFGHWQKLPLTFGLQPWTDDFTNIVSIWKKD